jgi:geranylgeranyl pyrophosphate synthase
VDLDHVRSEIDEALAEVLAAGLAEAPPTMAEAIRYAVLAPGKRVRPLLVVAAYDAGGGSKAGGKRGAVLRLACSVELVHAYSLVHDDLPCMDDDDLRRGRPTVHVRFGERGAIFAGAALMPLAVEVLGMAAEELGVGDEAAARLSATLTSAAGAAGMVGGQLLDLRAEGRSVDLGELERIHEGKTARLIEASCIMGGIAAGASDEVVTHLGRYGRSLGLAFQVVDDILDVTGTAQSMGKAGGRDAELGKATYPDLVGLRHARARAADLVSTALGELDSLVDSKGLSRIATVVVERER